MQPLMIAMFAGGSCSLLLICALLIFLMIKYKNRNKSCGTWEQVEAASLEKACARGESECTSAKKEIPMFVKGMSGVRSNCPDLQNKLRDTCYLKDYTTLDSIGAKVKQDADMCSGGAENVVVAIPVEKSAFLSTWGVEDLPGVDMEAFGDALFKGSYLHLQQKTAQDPAHTTTSTQTKMGGIDICFSQEQSDSMDAFMLKMGRNPTRKLPLCRNSIP